MAVAPSYYSRLSIYSFSLVLSTHQSCDQHIEEDHDHNIILPVVGYLVGVDVVGECSSISYIVGTTIVVVVIIVVDVVIVLLLLLLLFSTRTVYYQEYSPTYSVRRGCANGYSGPFPGFPYCSRKYLTLCFYKYCSTN